MTNPECPDFMAHYENAADRIIPDRGGSTCANVTPDEDEAIRAEAEAEYLNCEGH